jgi:hypothetical protein
MAEALASAINPTAESSQVAEGASRIGYPPISHTMLRVFVAIHGAGDGGEGKGVASVFRSQTECVMPIIGTDISHLIINAHFTDDKTEGI